MIPGPRRAPGDQQRQGRRARASPATRTRRRSTDLNQAAKCTTAAAEERNRACQPLRSTSAPIADSVATSSCTDGLHADVQNVQFLMNMQKLRN